MDGLAAVANDPNGNVTIQAADFEDGQKRVRASVKFTSAQARDAMREIEDHKREMDHKGSVDHARVLMTFKRSDIGNADVGKRSGERVIVESISEKDLPLVYSSEIAEQTIKHEIRDTEENIYFKGFVVDVNVEVRNGKPVAYRVTNVHQIIELPRDDDD